MARLGDLIVNIGANTRGLNSKLGDVQKRMRGTFNNIQKMGVGMSAAVTAPLAAIAARSFGVAADFEQSMAKVAAVSGATGKQFQMLEQDAMRLGSATRFTATEVSGLQLEFAKLGFTSDEITKVTESTLALAQASGSDLARSAEVAGATLRGFGLDAEETSRVTDVMAASFSGTALDMESFAESMKYVAPVAKAAGLSIEETTAMLGTLANAGIKGSSAGTALRRIISELGATGGDVAGAISNLATQGLNLADAKDEVGRSAQSALLVLSKGTATTAELGEAFRNAQGKAKQMAGVMDDTSRGALARMQSAIEGAQISMGKVLAPIVEKLAGFVSTLASKFQQLSPQVKKTLVVIAGIAAAIGPAMVLVSSMATVLPVLGTAIGAAFTAATGPIGLTVLAVGALASAVLYFWDDIKGPLTNVINYFIRLYNESEFLRIAIAALQEMFVATFNLAKRGAMNVVESFALLSNAIQTGLTEGFGAAFEVIQTGMAQMVSDTLEVGKEVYEGFKDGLNKARTRDPIELVTTEDMDNAMDKFKSLFDIFSGGGGSPMQQIAEDSEAAIKPLKALTVQTASYNKELITTGQNIPFVAQEMKWFRQEMGLILHFKEDIENALYGIGEALGNLAAGAVTGAHILGQAIEGMGAFLKKLGKSMIAQAVAMKEFQKALIGNPVKAALAGVAFVAAGALVQNLGQKFAEGQVALAKGGLAYGPTSAIVGDNPNARMDPEVIAPLSKLKDIMGGGAVQVYGRISGSDIVLANDRGTRNRNRVI